MDQKLQAARPPLLSTRVVAGSAGVLLGVLGLSLLAARFPSLPLAGWFDAGAVVSVPRVLLVALLALTAVAAGIGALWTADPRWWAGVGVALAAAGTALVVPLGPVPLAVLAVALGLSQWLLLAVVHRVLRIGREADLGGLRVEDVHAHPSIGR